MSKTDKMPGKAYVEGVFEGMKERFRRRKRGAMELRVSEGATGVGLCVLKGGAQ